MKLALAVLILALRLGLRRGAVTRKLVKADPLLPGAARRSLREAHNVVDEEDSDAGLPSFLQTHSSAAASAKGNVPLFPVFVMINEQHYDPRKGITISMDKRLRGMRVDNGVNTSGVAWARLFDKLNETGWTELVVETTDSERVSNDVKMYAAGYVEGVLTAVRTSQFYANFYQTMMIDADANRAYQNVRNMFWNELEYVKKKSNFMKGPSSPEPTDPYFKHSRYIYEQVWGLKDGYNHLAKQRKVNSIDMIDMMVINSHGELAELMEVYAPPAVRSRRAFQEQAAQKEESESLLQRSHGMFRKTATPNAASNSSAGDWLAHLSERDWEHRLQKHGHCSSLVRLGPDSRDLFVGHTTWSDYGKMTRVFKYYNFKLSQEALSATRLMGFSSYPGCVSSTDDFYLLDSGLVVMDTSLEILNPVLYNRVAEFPANPHIPNFMHVMVVNRLARSGGHWTTLFTDNNAGTNSAQWTIVDYNRFIPGGAPEHGTVRLAEQVPGYSHHADVTAELLTRGYWASYNRPFFETVREMTGHTAAEKVHGQLFSFWDSPRATIFKRLSLAVDDLFDMRSLMNRNDYPHENVEPNLPGHAISARMDLDPYNAIPNGGIDAKVTSRCLFRQLQCQAISGPSHDQEPVFKWRDDKGRDIFPGWPHFGMPDVWNYTWVQMTPSDTLTRIVDPKGCG